LDEQVSQIFAATNTIAERVRKLGAVTLRFGRASGSIRQLG